MHTTNPLRIVYDELYRLSNAGHITWCTYVHDVGELLTSIGLGNIWEGQNISAGNVNELKSYFKVELERHYTRKWLQDINDIEQNPILRTCAVFKEKHCLENYIQCLSSKNYQQAISCFRVSSHFPQTRHWTRATPKTTLASRAKTMHFLQLKKIRRRDAFSYSLWNPFHSPKNILLSCL